MKKALEALKRKDKVLKQLIRRAGPVELRRRTGGTPFESLCSSIIYQQLNGKAAAKILERLVALFPAKKMTAPRLLKMHARKLRKAGVSRNKIRALRDVAEKKVQGLLPGWKALSRWSDAEIIERLTQ